MSKRFRVRYKIELEGEMEIDAEGRSDAVGIIRGDTPFADLVCEIDLSDQSSDNISVLSIEEVK